MSEQADASRRGGRSRREFLQTGVGAAAAAALASRVYAAEAAPRKIRMGVVGGGMGCALPWHAHPNCTVEAVADLREDRRRALVNTFAPKKVYESIEELVRDKNVEAVSVFSDGPLHVQHVELVMRHGKHAISAVPACMGSLEDAELLLETVKKYGLTYMMAETSYFNQASISARKFYQEGQFGEIFYSEAQYDHPGLEGLYWAGKQRTWRHGMAPMHYPTHCTSYLTGVTGERLTEVSCIGWGDNDPICKDNFYNNPFWSEIAFFKTDRGHAFRVRVSWRGAMRGGEYARWYGNKMSFFMDDPNGLPPIIVRTGGQMGKDSGGFQVALPEFERYQQPEWYKTDMLPEALRRASGHGGSHVFLVHEFISALLEGRAPVIDVYEALSETVPGLIAHESALRGGELLKIPQYARPASATKVQPTRES